MILVSHALAFPVLLKGVDNAEDLAHRYLLPLHLQGQLTVSRGSACLRGSSKQTACEARDGLGFDVIVFACVLMSLQKANAFILFVKCLLSGWCKGLPIRIRRRYGRRSVQQKDALERGSAWIGSNGCRSLEQERRLGEPTYHARHQRLQAKKKPRKV